MLLDANAPHDLRSYLRHHDTFTAAYLGWADLKNGDLLRAAEGGGFDVLVTGDKTLHREQSLSGRKIALVCLSAVNWPVIGPHIAKIVAAVDNATPGSFVLVDVGRFSRPKNKRSLS